MRIMTAPYDRGPSHTNEPTLGGIISSGQNTGRTQKYAHETRSQAGTKTNTRKENFGQCLQSRTVSHQRTHAGRDHKQRSKEMGRRTHAKRDKKQRLSSATRAGILTAAHDHGRSHTNRTTRGVIISSGQKTLQLNRLISF